MQTDIMIPNSSRHPYEHKLSGIKYVLILLHTYPITKISEQTEKHTIKILQKMNIAQFYLRNHYHSHKNKTYTKNPSTTKQNGPFLHIAEKKSDK
jgi:hypothetical protein